MARPWLNQPTDLIVQSATRIKVLERRGLDPRLLIRAAAGLKGSPGANPATKAVAIKASLATPVVAQKAAVDLPALETVAVEMIIEAVAMVASQRHALGRAQRVKN
jgi:hypothetical protein